MRNLQKFDYDTYDGCIIVIVLQEKVMPSPVPRKAIRKEAYRKQ